MASKKSISEKRAQDLTEEDVATLGRILKNGTDRAKLRAARIVLAITMPVPGEDWEDWEEDKLDDADTDDRGH
jgi:hypothetical protein